MDLATVGYAVFGGVVWNLAGYFRKPREKYEPEKLLRSALIGAVVGVVAMYKGLSFQNAYDFATAIGLIGLVENIGKAIYRRL